MSDILLLLSTTSSTTDTASADMYGSLVSIGMLVLMFVVFYFILIRPQRKRDKELKEQMEHLAVGDKVATIGGLVGYVANIKDDEITISTSAANTLVTFTKASIQTVVKRENIGKPAATAEKKGIFSKKSDKDDE